MSSVSDDPQPVILAHLSNKRLSYDTLPDENLNDMSRVPKSNTMISLGIYAPIATLDTMHDLATECVQV